MVRKEQEFINALKEKDTSKIKDLLPQIDEIDFSDQHGNSILHYLVQQESIKLLSEFLEKGPDLNKSNNIGETPLSLLIFHEYDFDKVEHIILLLVNGANPNYKQKRNDWTFLHHATFHNQIKVVETLIRHDASVNESKNIDRWTPLHMVRGLEIAKALLSNGATRSFHEKDKSGLIPIMTLLNSECDDRSEIVNLFFSEGFEFKESEGNKALKITILNNDPESLRILINAGVNIDTMTGEKQSAIHLAASYGFFEIVKVLIEEGANPNDTGHPDKFTPVYHSIINEDYEILDFLIDHGATLDFRDNQDKSPYDYVTSQQMKEYLKK